MHEQVFFFTNFRVISFFIVVVAEIVLHNIEEQAQQIYKRIPPLRLRYVGDTFKAARKGRMTKEIIPTLVDIREFKKLLRRRQRERHKTIGYNEKNKGPARAL